MKHLLALTIFLRTSVMTYAAAALVAVFSMGHADNSYAQLAADEQMAQERARAPVEPNRKAGFFDKLVDTLDIEKLSDLVPAAGESAYPSGERMINTYRGDPNKASDGTSNGVVVLEGIQDNGRVLTAPVQNPAAAYDTRMNAPMPWQNSQAQAPVVPQDYQPQRYVPQQRTMPTQNMNANGTVTEQVVYPENQRTAPMPVNQGQYAPQQNLPYQTAPAMPRKPRLVWVEGPQGQVVHNPEPKKKRVIRNTSDDAAKKAQAAAKKKAEAEAKAKAEEDAKAAEAEKERLANIEARKKAIAERKRRKQERAEQKRVAAEAEAKAAAEKKALETAAATASATSVPPAAPALPTPPKPALAAPAPAKPAAEAAPVIPTPVVENAPKAPPAPPALPTPPKPPAAAVPAADPDAKPAAATPAAADPDAKTPVTPAPPAPALKATPKAPPAPPALPTPPKPPVPEAKPVAATPAAADPDAKAAEESPAVKATANAIAQKPKSSGKKNPNMRIVFKSTETTVPLSVSDDLNKLAKQLIQNDNERVTLIAYASSSGDQVSTARRISLSRALSVRAFLIDAGVNNLRINVQAEGDKNPGGEADRVDLFVQSVTGN